MKTTYIFRRMEKKYLLSELQRTLLLREIGARLSPDAFGKSTVCSVYLDTPDHLLIRNSIDAHSYKEKLRLRSYGIPSPDTEVFLEIKKKFEGVVYKRRISLPLKDAERYFDSGTPPLTGQIMSEIDYAMRFYRHPKPKMLLACEREAWYAEDNPDLRLTFDAAIRYRETALSLARGSSGTLLLPSDTVLLEIKTAGAMPLWLSHALDRNGILPASFSKYGEAYKAASTQHEVSVIPEGGYSHVSHL